MIDCPVEEIGNEGRLLLGDSYTFAWPYGQKRDQPALVVIGLILAPRGGHAIGSPYALQPHRRLR